MTFSKRLFFDEVRSGILGPTLDAGEVDGCDRIIDAFAEGSLAHCAYALATAYHETAGTMQPIKEYGSANYFRRRYDIQGENPALAKRLGNTVPGDGVNFAGRGYVQLTGRSNFSKAGKKLGLPLTDNPALAMQPEVAAKIMRDGMEEGWFTGKKLSDYLPIAGLGDRAQFKQARRIINGTDRADLIAGYAMSFQDALAKGGW